MRIWSWQHVSVIHCWVEPSLLLSSFQGPFLTVLWRQFLTIGDFSINARSFETPRRKEPSLSQSRALLVDVLHRGSEDPARRNHLVDLKPRTRSFSLVTPWAIADPAKDMFFKYWIRSKSNRLVYVTQSEGGLAVKLLNVELCSSFQSALLTLHG